MCLQGGTGGKCCSQACVLVLQRLQEQSLGIALQCRKISIAGTWASLFSIEICIQTDVILCNIKEESQKCSKGVLLLETACENTGKNQDLGIFFFSSFLLLVAVNGSPATITIETCEDTSDWSTSIGGMAWDPAGLAGWGRRGERGKQQAKKQEGPSDQSSLAGTSTGGLFLCCLWSRTVLYPSSVWAACGKLAMKLFPSTNISKPEPNVALGENKFYQRDHGIILLDVTGCSKVSCWCGTGVGRVYPSPLGPCSGWALPQLPDLGGLSQPSRISPLQGFPQGTQSRSPLSPAVDFEVLPCFLFLQMTPLLFGKA